MKLEQHPKLVASPTNLITQTRVDAFITSQYDMAINIVVAALRRWPTGIWHFFAAAAAAAAVSARRVLFHAHVLIMTVWHMGIPLLDAAATTNCDCEQNASRHHTCVVCVCER